MEDEINTLCKSILQRDVRFVLNDKKVLRRGKLILFNTKDYFITFTIDSTKNTRKIYEVYYPFSITNNKKKNRLEFGYRVEDISNDIKIHVSLMNAVNKTEAPSQFFGSQMFIYYDGA
jgi:hypothetical protein